MSEAIRPSAAGVVATACTQGNEALHPILPQIAWESYSENHFNPRVFTQPGSIASVRLSVDDLQFSPGSTSRTVGIRNRVPDSEVTDFASGIVQSVEVTQDVAKEKRFLVTINEVSAT